MIGRVQVGEVCEALGVDPHTVRTIIVTPSDVQVEHYATNADGQKYVSRRSLGRPEPVTFWRHDEVRE